MAADDKKIKIIVTLGPSTHSERDLRFLKAKGVDFVRLNMSHSSTKDLKAAIELAQKVGIPFIVDTEGSQVRTGRLKEKTIAYEVGDEVRIYEKPFLGTRNILNLTPAFVVGKLQPGDLLYCDFDSLVMCVADITTLKKRRFITARVISGGMLGSNKGVFIDPASGRSIDMPPLSSKDYESIKIGLAAGVEHIAASFMRSGGAVKAVRKATKGRMKIISKVECIDGLKNLDDIIDESEYLLIDRGDLSKEIFVTRIPFTQKIIVHRARRKHTPVIVATNFLESMVHNRRPTRAEIHDIESSITDGAGGLTLAAETAIGAYPMECLAVMQNVIHHVTSAIDVNKYAAKEEKLVSYLEKQNYLLDFNTHSSLIPPHGGTLVDRTLKVKPDDGILRRLPKLQLSEESQMDVEQIAIGAYSPLDGFMGKKELASVLDTMRLPNGIIWPLPILLDVSAEEAEPLKVGETIVLLGDKQKPMALLHLEEKYIFNTNEIAEKLYGTKNIEHPGVQKINSLKPIFLAGNIDLVERRQKDTAFLELTPRQTRRLFEERGWSRVVGFHTRNAIHRSHEFIQLRALESSYADGLFVHPVIGKKKTGDFNYEYIVKSYDIMMRQFYPKNKVLFAVLATYSRYAGPKEALFTAIIRQNFGCSHFIVGRDHAGVGDFYPADASHKIFDQFPDLGIIPVRFSQVFYSKKLKSYIHEKEDRHAHTAAQKLMISGTEVRKILAGGKVPPDWFMRKEISAMIADAINKGKKVFVQ
ncbi:MAG: sulfate adenylyltransferase [Minisyncoccia bacterium]|jgi:pyruvate kinase